MSVVVRNERNQPYVFSGSRGTRQIAPGEIAVISETEWDDVITALRGPGEINPLWPNEVSSDIAAMKFDYYTVGADTEVRYIGFAQQGILTSEDRWVIKRFGHETIGDGNYVNDIQVLQGVAWDDRASLDWL